MNAVKGSWQPIHLALDVPEQVEGEKVAKLLFLVFLRGFDADDVVHVDDAALFRLGDVATPVKADEKKEF